MAVLITGASSGIGKELAKVFSYNGHEVVLVARRKEKLLKLKKSLEKKGGKASVIAADLTQEKAIEKIHATLTKEKIHIDTLVNNAGFGDFGDFAKSEWKKQADMIELNIKSLTHLTHIFLPDLIKSKGYLLNVASVAGFISGPKMSVYCATKNYVLAFSEAIAEELDEHEVTVSTLCPGYTQSEFQQVADMEHAINAADYKKFPTSAAVAQYGYDSLMSGKRVAVHGWSNKATVFFTRFIPRLVLVKFVKKMLE